MISLEAVAPPESATPFCLYERFMGAAARERAADLIELAPDRFDQIEVMEVWGTPSPDDHDRELRLYDFGGRVLAVARSR